MLLLLGCNAGSGQNNIAMAFAEKIGQGGRAIAADGIVRWYPSWFGQPNIRVEGNGYSIFNTTNGVVNSQSILQHYINVRTSPGSMARLMQGSASKLRNS